MNKLERLKSKLERHHPSPFDPSDRNRSSVAIILLENATGLELLFIERAKRLDEPWSGHIAFPGGRPNPTDLSQRATAERETLEETGIDLKGAEFLGQLNNVRGRTKPVIVSAFVFGLLAPPALTLNSEVADAFWIPLSQLSESNRQTSHLFQGHGLDERVPAINLLGAGRPLLWGLTHRLTLQLLSKLDRGKQIPVRTRCAASHSKQSFDFSVFVGIIHCGESLAPTDTTFL